MTDETTENKEAAGQPSETKNPALPNGEASAVDTATKPAAAAADDDDEDDLFGENEDSDKKQANTAEDETSLNIPKKIKIETRGCQLVKANVSGKNCIKFLTLQTLL